jgi:branched-chain amino acid transport system ATP-binding protein
VSLLEVEELRAGYGPMRVLHGVTFAVEEGQAVALLGANGAGKTTTLRAISGLLPGTGHATFAGAPLLGRRAEQLVRLGLAHVVQGRGNVADLTVAENLRLGAWLRRDRAGVRADIRRVLAAFPPLAERGGQPAGTLSGGEQQMLAIARALVLRPRLLLLDEPSLGLAPKVTREVFDALAGLVREDGTALVVVEQNANLVLAFADRAYVLEAGRVALDGDAETIASDPALRRAYLGY